MWPPSTHTDVSGGNNSLGPLPVVSWPLQIRRVRAKCTLHRFFSDGFGFGPQLDMTLRRRWHRGQTEEKGEPGQRSVKAQERGTAGEASTSGPTPLPALLSCRLGSCLPLGSHPMHQRKLPGSLLSILKVNSDEWLA